MSSLVLITGGWGYVGGRVAVAIARRGGWKVRLTSRRPRPDPSWLPGAERVVMDLLDRESVEAATSGVRAVVHLAAVNEMESAANPDLAARINSAGTRDLLESALGAGVERFVYFSTAHVYGAPLAGHITEAVEPRPVHPYASTHYEAERFVLAARAQRRVGGIVLRLSNGFGAPTHPAVDRWTLLVNDLCYQAVWHRRLVLRSAGHQQRDFVTLEDVGRATGHFLELPDSLCGDGLFNVGAGRSLSVWEMAQRVAQNCRRTLGYEPPISRTESPPAEPVPELIYDIGKLRGTAFVLQGDLEDEIRQTLQVCAGFRPRGT